MFRKNQLELLKGFYLIPYRDSANLAESGGRTVKNRLEDMEEFLKKEMRGRKQLGLEETILSLERYTDAVFQKLEMAVVHGSRVVSEQH